MVARATSSLARMATGITKHTPDASHLLPGRRALAVGEARPVLLMHLSPPLARAMTSFNVGTQTGRCVGKAPRPQARAHAHASAHARARARTRTRART
eukprot:10970175-Alexandrium_andersonii.AAC.1